MAKTLKNTTDAGSTDNPSRFVVVMIPDEQGAVIDKQEHRSERAIVAPDDAILVAVSDQSSLTSKTIDKAVSPWYDEQADGSYRYNPRALS